MNFHSLKLMSDKDLVECIPKILIPNRPCEGCLVGKQSCNSYHSQANYRVKKRLELVHSYLCGPVSPPTPARNRYFMLLVDDYSRVMSVYLMKTKNEDVQVFKNFRAKVEIKIGEKIKVLRTDHGGEFLSNYFTSYCNETGLDRHYTAPYSLQQNGVMERRNRTVLEMVRSSLKFMKVPNVLWGEAVSYIVYVLNRVNTKALKDTTPYEVWTGRKPPVEHLRVFGCVGHMRVSKSYLKKLEDRSMKVVHLVVERRTKAYRVLDPDTGLIYVSRNVCFEENKSWPWETARKI